MRSELDVAASDAARFQSWIRERQYPSDCAATTGFFTRQDYFYKLGLGAQMVSLKFNLLHALLHKKVYHFPTTHYVNPLRCPSRSFDCYFERPSNCTRATHAAAEEVKIHWCFDVPRRRLSRLAGLRAVHSKAWYHAQLAAFIYRPNAALRDFARMLLGSMEGNRTRAAVGVGGGWRRNSSCVAMHIRRTDKHTEDHRTAQRGFADFAQTFKSWAYWAYPGAAAGLEVFIGSEDRKTFGAMPAMLAPNPCYWIPSRHFVMDMSPGKRFVNIRQGNERLLELYGLLEDEARDAKRASAKAGDGGGAAPSVVLAARLLKDEGMTLISQMLLMSGCEAFIGSYSSNVAILVHDLMLARRGARGEAMHAIDVNGRVYCGCGASFCMTAERKAVRDPTKSVRQIVDAFRY